MPEPRMTKVMGDGVEIQLAVWDGEGPTILCVHGITANCRCWDVIAKGLTPKFRLIAMDLRGRGLSGKPPKGYSIPQHCRDITAVLDAIQVEKATIMGHSLGAFICVVYAATQPQRVDRAVLVDGGGRLSEEQANKVFEGIRPSLERLGRVFPSFDDYIEQMKKAPFLQPWSDALETYFRYEVEEVQGGVRSRVLPECVQEEALNLRQMDVSIYYPQISCPVLILRAPEGMLARDDILLPQGVVDRMLKEIPDARCVDIEGTNHYSIAFGDCPSRDRAILEFIK